MFQEWFSPSHFSPANSDGQKQVVAAWKSPVISISVCVSGLLTSEPDPAVGALEKLCCSIRHRE